MTPPPKDPPAPGAREPEPTGWACPECRSGNVDCTPTALIEIFRMHCDSCGLTEFADEYQMDRWNR